jgi:hypothetical protein
MASNRLSSEAALAVAGFTLREGARAAKELLNSGYSLRLVAKALNVAPPEVLRLASRSAVGQQAVPENSREGGPMVSRGLAGGYR